jgi:hypothetical protein
MRHEAERDARLLSLISTTTRRDADQIERAFDSLGRVQESA